MCILPQITHFSFFFFESPLFSSCWLSALSLLAFLPPAPVSLPVCCPPCWTPLPIPRNSIWRAAAARISSRTLVGVNNVVSAL
ncbi:hypothetical protein PR003_g18425 [Phytophthora rubi]|uniref:Secreted protein n=1 Tax=Phytophthora rubi TaxID=129364 RepID=A0A6A4E0S4_9STRA|nr:hypothetical protein PR002_g6420 [Phytophthora rubi]KAE9043137.1 hypothetical protein PR001_g5923 [Phytophthora rubi]KAE9317655.1 hypothetical protein PR003_g18425 [Phytophthora rubi]